MKMVNLNNPDYFRVKPFKEGKLKYTNLGRTGLKVSRLCLGTMNFGPRTTEPDSHAIMDTALEMGINFFDTANNYGAKLGEGVTEQIIGRWLEKDKSRRDRIVLATKVYCDMGTRVNEHHLSAYHIRRACDESLKRLKTDHIDLYQMHHVDRDTPWDEIWQMMETLVTAGKVLYVGSSNFAGWDIADCCHVAQKRNSVGLVCEQSHYNLFQRAIEREVIPACTKFGLGIIPWSPLDGGRLGGVLGEKSSGRRGSDEMRKKVEAARPTVEAWEKLCKDLGERPADVALAWLLHQPAVTAPIIGPRTMAHLEESKRVLEIILSAETLARIDAIFPPCGVAPNCYAW
jgi:aryl-alcohol dehydrogenase-like predicted oxidoreductase